MIEFEDVTKRFGDTTAIAGLSFTIEEGAFCVLIGPSGCGKSTVLRMMNALIAPDAGTIKVRGDDIAALPPERLRRGIGYVIQSVGLFPHWTIAENILAVPRLLRWDDSRLAARLADIVALVGIDGTLLARYPHQLSGGQQQRIGVARALAGEPDIVLMDEPFAALDPLSRANLQNEMRRIHAESGTTIVFVTHDMDEALRLATRILVLNGGRLVQAGAPADILADPHDDFVRAFLGGAERQLRLLDHVTVGARMQTGSPGQMPGVAPTATLKEALTLMLSERRASLGVVDDQGANLGAIDIDDIIGARHAE